MCNFKVIPTIFPGNTLKKDYLKNISVIQNHQYIKYKK